MKLGPGLPLLLAPGPLINEFEDLNDFGAWAARAPGLDPPILMNSMS